MDTFVDSAWYYFRYLSPNDETQAFDPEAVQRWMPVDHYTGGIEHAILHLLYSRFITKVLNDMGMIAFREPFPTLLNQGLVIMEGAKMSKSKGNIVELLPLIDRWGADTIRVAELFVGPVDEDSDWSYASPEAIHSWLNRIWRIAHQQASSKVDASNDQASHRALRAPPLQRGDRAFDGVDERDPDRAGWGRFHPRRCHGPGGDGCSDGSVHRRGAVARGSRGRGERA
jgi:leucyl-tRNA synthetase